GKDEAQALGIELVAVLDDDVLELGGQRVAAIPALGAARVTQRVAKALPGRARGRGQTNDLEEGMRGERGEGLLPGQTGGANHANGNASHAQTLLLVGHRVKPAAEIGNTAQTSGATPNDFASPVTYTVTAADNSTKDYIVTVTIAPSSAKEINSFE